VLAPRHGTAPLLPHVCSEPVSVLLQSPYVRFQQPKYSLGIQCVRARCSQPDYVALLSLRRGQAGEKRFNLFQWKAA
jgi:hypothetical protein